MTTGIDLVLAAPQDFLAAPAQWLEWCAEFGGTATAGPELRLRARGRVRCAALDRLDLSALAARAQRRRARRPRRGRGASSRPARRTGSTPGRCSRRSAWPRRRSRSRSPSPAAGLAVDAIDGRVLENEHYAAPVARRARHGAAPGACSAGPSRPSSPRRATPATGRVMRDREVGELEIRGTSVTPGYYRRPDATAARSTTAGCAPATSATSSTASSSCAGASRTSSSSAAATCSPQDVERAVADVDGVRAGNVIAFGTAGRRGREAIVVVAESARRR